MTDGLHVGAEEVPGVVEEQGQDEREQTEAEGDGGKHLHTLLDAEHDGDVRRQVMTTTMKILFRCSFTSSSRRCANLRMFSTPRPREVHTPKVVVTMDGVDESPRGEYTRLPRRG